MNHLKYILLLVLLVLLVGCESDKCLKFHEGKFKVGENYIYERGNGVQTEYNLEKNTKTRDSIIWLNKCQYELIPISTDNKDLEEYFENKKFVVTIVRVKAKMAFCTVTTDGDNYNFSMTKIE